jgi:hypothetical protein
MRASCAVNRRCPEHGDTLQQSEPMSAVVAFREARAAKVAHERNAERSIESN